MRTMERDFRKDFEMRVEIFRNDMERNLPPLGVAGQDHMRAH